MCFFQPSHLSWQSDYTAGSCSHPRRLRPDIRCRGAATNAKATFSAYPAREATFGRGDSHGVFAVLLLGFKELAVKRASAGLGIGAAAREVSLVEQTLRNWVKATKIGKLNAGGRKTVTPEQKELSWLH